MANRLSSALRFGQRPPQRAHGSRSYTTSGDTAVAADILPRTRNRKFI